MKRKIIVISFLAAVMLAGCSGESSTTKEVTPKKSETQNIKELVQDYSTGKIKDESASITSQKLIVTKNDDSKLTYDLPEDEFFVSIAPYIKKTHPCSDHSLTGCQGELVDEEFDVYIEDTESNVIMDKKVTTQSNGFIDLWLPRDKKYHITIAQDGKKAESEFSTFESDGTCITTIQLKENI
ncbi:CueP family metal-binding protein [Bacillus massilinigeriensis]|uniref:CueP family metal-binding protein n=1 Tax=Bacillus massilionigeriensis TaxID=1805475 RepID=UPI00096AE173|nr:CueP family metal-binding protein [Bacillus massilionigeriensis]